jgi:chromate transporter
MLALLNILWTFFKIGLFTFGGGYAMIPLIISELTNQGLVTLTEVTDIIAVSQVTPGTFAINAATFSGVKTFGVLGGLFATVGVMLPSIILASIMGRFYIKFKDNLILKNTMFTMRPIVLGLIASAAISLVPTSLFKSSINGKIDLSVFFSSLDIFALIIAVLALFAVLKLKISPVFVVILSGVIGVFIYGVF